MAVNVVDMKKSTVGSEEVLYFLEVPTDLATPETKKYHMAFLRNESNSKETGVERETIADVTQKVQPQEVKSYSVTQPFDGPFLKEDPVCRYLMHVFDKKLTGGDAHVNMVEVRKYEKGGNVAYKRDVVVAVENVTGEAGALLRISGNYGYASDDVEGTATIDNETGVCTFTPKGTE